MRATKWVVTLLLLVGPLAVWAPEDPAENHEASGSLLAGHAAAARARDPSAQPVVPPPTLLPAPPPAQRQRASGSADPVAAPPPPQVARTDAQEEDRGDPDVRTESVCFTVHNPGDPIPRRVVGTRYRTGAATREVPAILLVHGATTRAIWDFREDFSVARRLAQAGYMVIAYDQLGFGDSPYGLPGGGLLLSFQASRSMLHEVVGALRTGHYGIDGSCPADQGGNAEAGSEKVILIGHSAGGALVGGYAGLYHDVAAVVQMSWSTQGINPQFLLPGGAGWNAIRQALTANDHAFFFLDDQGAFNRNQCERFAIDAEGVEPHVGTQLCGHPAVETIGAPVGWLATLALINTENGVHVGHVGAGLPVLIVWSEFDWLFRPEDREAENALWRRHCGCDLTVWTQPGAGHALQVHRSMPDFVDAVTTWLHAKGL